MPPIRVCSGAQLDAAALHGLLRLRVDVFVVEQRCAYAEIDGRDLDAGTLHLWVEEAGAVVACARLLGEAEGSRLGRIATHPAHRRHGLASLLVAEALVHARRPVWLSAQSQLEDWYARRGFRRQGEDFVEDGILHVPMVLR